MFNGNLSTMTINHPFQWENPSSSPSSSSSSPSSPSDSFKAEAPRLRHLRQSGRLLEAKICYVWNPSFSGIHRKSAQKSKDLAKLVQLKMEKGLYSALLWLDHGFAEVLLSWLCAAATQPVFLPEAYADTHKKVLLHFQPRLPATLLKRFNSLRSTYINLLQISIFLYRRNGFV